MILKKWERDKWKHFFVAIPLGIILAFVAGRAFPGDVFISSLSAFVILLIICFGFEVFSLVTGKGHYDLVDAIAGVLGGIIGISAGQMWM